MRRGSRKLLLSCLLSLSLSSAVAACGSSSEADSPVSALTRFLEAMDKSAHNEHALEEAYALIDRADQRALADRAEQAELVAGRDFAPWEMLVQGRYRRRFVPADRGGMRAEVRGDTAVVHVVGSDGRTRAEVPLVKQGGAWRVKLGIRAIERTRERTTQ